MFLSTVSIRRPVAMCSLIIALSLLGINAYRKMGLEYLPQIDMPYITIVTVYPGGSPSEIETDIAKRIEDVVVSIDGLKHVTSACMENLCQTLLEFHLNVDVDVAANDVREKLDLIVNDFPSGTEKPKVLKFNINAKPIINLALTGDVPIDELFDFADNRLRDRITTLEGVADVQLIGGAKREVHVLLDREKLAARGLSSIDVVQAIQQEVRTIPSGRVREHGAEYSVKFDADYATVAAIGSLQVAGGDGQRCYLKDIGEVRMSTEELRQKAYIDGRPAIGIQVVKKAEANAEAVVTRVENAMAELQQALPGGMELVWVTDDGAFIRSTVDSTISNIWQGVALTALILFLFLYSFRTTIIVAITMPLTIIIGLFFMYYMGYTLNTVTLISIGLSIGILVTNSIVVLESIVKRMEIVEDPWAASLLGAREIGVAVLASAGTNVVVLFPIAMMGTQIGLFLRPFSLTMVVMTVVSLFISFTLTPIMCAVMLKKRVRRAGSILAFIERHWNRGFDHVAAGFAAVLRFFEKRRWAAALFLVLLAIGFLQSLEIASIVGFTFITDPDRAEMFVKLEYPTRYDLSRTVERVTKVEDQLRTLPEIRHIFTTIGKVEGMMGRTSEGVYLAQILLRLSEKTERRATLDELMEQARTLLADYPECVVTVGRPSGIGGQSTPIELEFYGDDFGELDRLALDSQRFAGEIWGLTDPDTTVRIGKPELRVRPHRAVLADLGVPATGLRMALRPNLEGLDAGS